MYSPYVPSVVPLRFAEELGVCVSQFGVPELVELWEGGEQVVSVSPAGQGPWVLGPGPPVWHVFGGFPVFFFGCSWDGALEGWGVREEVKVFLEVANVWDPRSFGFMRAGGGVRPFKWGGRWWI